MNNSNSSVCTVTDKGVSIELSANPIKITIIVDRAATSEEIQLCAEIERTAATVTWLFEDSSGEKGVIVQWFRSIFPKPGTRDLKTHLDYYMLRLFRIARMGLTENQSLATATALLKNLQVELMTAEGARVKNGYMLLLGWRSVLFASIAFLLHLVCMLAGPPPSGTLRLALDSLLLMWAGAMIGCWLSFGIRNVDFNFANLGQPQADLLRPNVRLIFTGALTAVLGLTFILGVVNVEFGNLKTVYLWQYVAPSADGTGGISVDMRVLTALLIGVFCGISENALSTTVGARAAQVIGQISK